MPPGKNYPYPDPTPYVSTLLITPGTIIQRPPQIPGMAYGVYDTLEVLESHGVNDWLMLARTADESHVYQVSHGPSVGMYATRVRVRGY